VNQSQKAAYGWQRDGGNADYILVDESTAIPLFEPLTYADGALIACGFGTAYEGLRRSNVHGGEDLLVVGCGPVGMAAAMIGRILGARQIIGVERNLRRIEFLENLGIFDRIVVDHDDTVSQVLEATRGKGCEVAVDCSGSAGGRSTALECVSEWGDVSFIGEGGMVESEVSDTMLHKQITIHASWVTSLQGMEAVARMFADASIHPEMIVSHRFPLVEADQAYALAALGAAGKVILVP
jgi:threonine dehydrogenase-like Zn-dependent dehydrogenase